MHVVFSRSVGVGGELMALRRGTAGGSTYVHAPLQNDQVTVDFELPVIPDTYPNDHTYFAQFNGTDYCSVTITPHA